MLTANKWKQRTCQTPIQPRINNELLAHREKTGGDERLQFMIRKLQFPLWCLQMNHRAVSVKTESKNKEFTRLSLINFLDYKSLLIKASAKCICKWKCNSDT